MQKVFSNLGQICLYTLGCLYAISSNTALAEIRLALGEETAPSFLAQVTADGTVNTQVNQDGNVAEITGGEKRGDNLFYSFRDFSVNTGNEAAFLNANDIANIFSRVTGGNISNIDGLISANGSANLFLINPAGIIFGENARLDVGGSFYGSSADSILFEDGEFSATDLANPPLLTINAPIGLNFRDNPGEIVNRSIGQNSSKEVVGLEVLPGNNLASVGGKIKFDGGNVTARGGNIELGGLSIAGIVDINPDGSLSFPKSIPQADISLTNAANINTVGTGGGNITVNARNLELTVGEANDSLIGTGISTGISSESTSAEAQGGDVNINVAEKLFLDGSSISNDVASEGVGNAGGISINTGSLEAINGGYISASTLGQGNAGAVNITATGDITLAGEGSNGNSSGIRGSLDGIGNIEGIRISTNNLKLTRGAEIALSLSGKGNAGTVDITATGDISLAGENSNGISSRIIGQVFGNAISDTGEIIAPRGVGNVGGVRISTNNLTLTDGGQINASTYGEGDAGTVDIDATGDIIIAGENLGIDGLSSGIFSAVDGDGKTPNGNGSAISNEVGIDAVGNSGNVDLKTANLSISNSAIISAGTSGKGNGGAITVDASESITLDGLSPTDAVSGIFNIVNPDAVGNSGSIKLTTVNFFISNGALINAGTFGNGNGGSIETTTSNFSLSNGGAIAAFTQGDGNAGDLTFNIGDRLTLEENSLISAQAFGTNTSGGNITINAQDGFLVAFPNQNPGIGNDIVANSPAGIDGNIEIYAQGVFGLIEREAVSSNNFLENNTNDIDASGSIRGSIPIILIPSEIQGIPPVISSKQTTDSACQVGSDGTAKNGLVVNGKGGVAVAPDQPLSSQNIIVNNEITSEPADPKPIVTGVGKIQIARGIKVTKDGRVILTPYATNNAGERIPEIKPNCS